MNTLRALLWKEWRQQRWFLLIGFILFWIVPIILVNVLIYQTLPLHRIGHKLFEMQSGLTLGFGGLFAIILAVAIICAELNNNLSDFWQSRPISLAQWVLVKYCFGVGILIVSCVLCFLLPVSMMAIFKPSRFYSEMAVPIYHTFTLIMIYSTAFLIGSLVRQTVNAVILSVGAGLLMYFLPIVFPPLSFLSVFNIIVQGQSDWSKEIEHRSYINLMLAGSTTMLILALLSLHYHWQIRMGKPLMFWSLGGVFLILLGSAGFQLNSNLTCEQQIIFPRTQPKHLIYNSGVAMTGPTRGVILAAERKQKHYFGDMKYYLYRFDLAQPTFFQNDRILIGKVGLGQERYQTFRIFGSPDYPNHVYLLRSTGIYEKADTTGISLLTIDLNRPKKIINDLDLSSQLPYMKRSSLATCLYKDSIYVFCGPTLLRISLANPDKPEVITVLTEPSTFGGCQWEFDKRLNYWSLRANFLANTDTQLKIQTIQVPGLNDRERLELTIKLMAYQSQTPAFKNDLLVGRGYSFPFKKGTYKTYRLENLKNNEATFVLAGWQTATSLEQLFFHNNLSRGIILNNDFAWINRREGITVYDVRQSERPRLAGHFAAGGEQFYTMTPLPDGRMLLGGEKLYIVAPPKR